MLKDMKDNITRHHDIPILSKTITSSNLKDMRDNITRHHNIPFLSDINTRFIPKVMNKNIAILSALINENSLHLVSIFPY